MLFTPDFGVSTLDSGVTCLLTPDFGVSTLDFGVGTLDFGVGTLDFGVRCLPTLGKDICYPEIWGKLPRFLGYDFKDIFDTYLVNLTIKTL